VVRHTDCLPFEAKPEKSNPVYAHKPQKLIGGAYGVMTVTMQCLCQGWSGRMPGSYKHRYRTKGHAATSEQQDMGEPCIKAAQRQVVIRTDETRSGRCWPGFTTESSKYGQGEQ
jgi:hypothetical protein